MTDVDDILGALPPRKSHSKFLNWLKDNPKAQQAYMGAMEKGYIDGEWYFAEVMRAFRAKFPEAPDTDNQREKRRVDGLLAKR